MTAIEQRSTIESEIQPISAASPQPTVPFWHQLRWSLILTLTVLAVIPLGIAIPLILNRVRLQTQVQAINQLESIVELKSDQITRWLAEGQSALDAFLIDTVRNDEVFNLVEASLKSEDPHTLADEAGHHHNLNELLSRLVEAEPVFEEVFVYTRDGLIIAASRPEPIGKIVTRQPYFSASLVENYIQSPYYEVSARGGKLTLLVTRPLRSRQDGQTVGVLAGRLNLTTLADIMTERTGLGDRGETYLVSLQNNYFLTPSRFEGYELTQAYHSEAIDQVLRGQNGSDSYQNYQSPAVAVFGVYRWLPELEAGLVAEIEQSEALASYTQARNFSLALVAAVAVSAVMVGLVSATAISRPITALTQIAARIAAGDLSQRVEIQPRNEIGLLAKAFNIMTDQLRGMIGTLEERVAERTRALETGAEISRQLTTFLDVAELLTYVVDRVQREFNFYHTHIYLIEAGSGDLVLAHGFGEVGRQLMDKGHRLAAGRGIVGTVANTNEPFISNNVDEVANFVRNPLLPQTKSELAVPLRKGDQVLGVLDVQSAQLDRFSDQDVTLIQSIANQTATVLDNVRLLANTQANLLKIERLNRQITRQGWHELNEEIPTVGYRFSKGTSQPLSQKSEVWLPPMKQAIAKKQLVTHKRSGNGEGSQSELAVPLLLRGEVIGVLGVKREASDHWADEEVSAVEAVANQVALALENARLSEEQGKTITKLQEVDRIKSEFLTSMSHELRTPLNSIIGFADVIIQGIDGAIPDLALNDVKVIHNSGQHLLALINDILDISKIEAGMMELIREPLQIDEVVSEVLAATSSLVKDKPVKLVVDIPAALPAVDADKLRLNQILLNLVSNAIKFTGEGTVTIGARLAADPNQMLISVTDQGIGIPPDKFKAIFDRFSQADNSTTRQYGGTGLGLPICKQLVEMHGGVINLRSEVGVGSSFFFTIPLAKEVG
jgi:signal transduction histidine kinase/HAMP domain-containing protein